MMRQAVNFEMKLVGFCWLCCGWAISCALIDGPSHCCGNRSSTEEMPNFHRFNGSWPLLVHTACFLLRMGREKKNALRGERILDDLDLLPQALREQSRFDRELILPDQQA